MNRKFLSVVLSTMITATSCFSPLFVATASAVSDDATVSNAITTQSTSENSDPVTLNFYSYTRDYSRSDVTIGYKMDQKVTIKANRGDDIALNIYMKAEDEPYTSSLSLRYDLKEEDNIEEMFGVGGKMEVPLGSSKAEFLGKFIEKRDTSILEYTGDNFPVNGIKFNPIIQQKIEDNWNYRDIFYDDGAFQDSAYPTWDALGLVFSQSTANYNEFQQMREEMHFTASEGGDLYCTIPFHVSEDTTLGDEQTLCAYFPEFIGYDYSAIKVNEMTMEVTGSTYEEPSTEPPVELATAVVHFADDNESEPLTVEVGETFTYNVYLKLNHPEVQSFSAWTYFNQPVGTKKTPNQAGNTQIPEENQVLKVAENGFTPYYSPFNENMDLMKSDNYLIAFGMGYMNDDLSFNMLKTDNGSFTQEGGCLISTITFTVQNPGEVEVFTHLDDSIVDLDNGIEADYVAIYSEAKLNVKDVLVGDLDNNLEISLVDITLMNRYVLEPENTPDDEKLQKAMDINQDGEFTVIDVTMMSRYILGIESEGSYAGSWV